MKINLHRTLAVLSLWKPFDNQRSNGRKAPVRLPFSRYNYRLELEIHPFSMKIDGTGHDIQMKVNWFTASTAGCYCI